MSVAQEIKVLSPNSRLIYIGKKGDSLAETILDSDLIDEFHYIRAGKWRRYHGETFWQHIKDYRTVLLNIADFFNLIIGVVQAWLKLKKINPDAIFIKGGFVGLPVGISAKMRGINFITHDSDAIPGLTNRIVGRWALYNAVGMPEKLYHYPKNKTIYTGVPVSKEFTYVSEAKKAEYRRQLGLSSDDQVIFVVGGGLGAQRLNDAVVHIAKNLLADKTNLKLIHITGQANFEKTTEDYKDTLSPELMQKVEVIGFTNDLYRYSGCSDVVVMRAGATNFSEMAVQAKPCILVPNPNLTGGHQLKNVKFWTKAAAAEVYDETMPPSELQSILSRILDNSDLRAKLAESIKQMAKPDAAGDISKLLVEIAENNYL